MEEHSTKAFLYSPEDLSLQDGAAISAFADAVKEERTTASTFFSSLMPPSTFRELQELYITLDYNTTTNKGLPYILAHTTFPMLSVESPLDSVFWAIAPSLPESPLIQNLRVFFLEEFDEEDMSNDIDKSREECVNKRAAIIAALEEWETVPWQDATPWCHFMDHFPHLTELRIDLHRRVKPQDHALLCSQVGKWHSHSSLQTIWLYCSIPNTKTGPGLGPGLGSGRFCYHQVGEEWTLDTSQIYGIHEAGRYWVELPESNYYWYSAYC